MHQKSRDSNAEKHPFFFVSPLVLGAVVAAATAARARRRAARAASRTLGTIAESGREREERTGGIEGK